jgi:membrane associated rhomboid family serine protease
VTYWVLRLLIANVAVYFLELAVPGLVDQLAFVPNDILVRPWTLVTYTFLHDPNGFGHILFNMLGLYFFGPRLEDRLGGRVFLGLYFVSGVMGGVLSYAFARQYPIIGASGALFGVMLGYATFWPRDQVWIWGIFPVEARWLVIIMTVMSLYMAKAGGGGIAHYAHLGGFVGGFVYLRLLGHRARSKRFRRQTLPQAPRLETTTGAMERWKKIPRDTLHEVNRDELDRILDKISASGIGSLTPAEREFLDRFSTRH